MPPFRLASASLCAAAALLLSGCSAAVERRPMVPVAVSGRPFSEVALGQLRPGLVTFAEAVEWLGATPSVTVTLPDGGFLATWMFTAGTAYGVLESRMASLAFGRDGIFKRAVHLDNVRLGAAELERLKPMAVLNTRITVWP